MKLDEAQLSHAAVLVRERQLQQLPDADACPEHVFSDAFEQNMQELMEQIARGEIQQKKAAWGWPYYVRQGLVAVLICFLLACFTMPEAVLAGYHKLIEVVETVFEEYTEWRYETNAIVNDKLEKVTFGYMPETLKETEESLDERLYYVLYQGSGYYFCLEQRKLSQESEMTQIVDTEDAFVETKQINGEDVIFAEKDGVYHYIWVHNQYQISGISNLSVCEIEQILHNMQIE